MPTAEIIGIGLLALLLLVALVVLLRRMLVAKLGGFLVSWRHADESPGRGWVLGQARFRHEHLSLYRSFQVFPRASRRLPRGRLELGAQRLPVGVELDVLVPGVRIIAAVVDGEQLELAMSERALMGVRSWLEAAPGTGR